MELFDKLDKQFAEHLLVNGNERIVFSGRFGQGKTTFLTEFFKQENQQELFQNEKKYNVIHLFPVNYSIASNEDIFKYIKHDIILELLGKDSSIEDDIISYLTTLPAYLKKNAHKVLAAFVGMIPGVGKDVIESFEKFDNLKKEYLKYHDEQEKKYNEYAVLGDFIESLRSAEGSIYEDNIISKLIEDILSRQKNEGTENVLIIDDLDRIDPEHIFRILNVFSAHFDRKRQGNKFGFDKIIIVCDIDNIRGIFKTKYGTNADFNGYIDKFYSYRIFDFNNKNGINTLAKNLFYKADWARTEHGVGYDNSLDFHRSRFDNKLYFLYDIIDILSANGELQVRNILKLEKVHIHFISMISVKNVYYDMYEEPLLVFIRILIHLKGDANSLIDSLYKCDKIIAIHSDVIKGYVVELIRIYLLSNIIKSDNIRKSYYLNGQELVLGQYQNEYTLSKIPDGGFTCKQPELITVLIDVVRLFNMATYD